MATNPRPITPDNIERTVTSVNQNFNEISGRFRTNIVKDETGTPILLSGRRPDGTYGFDVSQPGVDVVTATNDQLAFSSKFNMFKILHVGELVIPQLSLTLHDTNTYFNSTSADYSHGLGFTPVVLGFVESDVTGGYQVMPQQLFDALGGGGGVRITSSRILATDSIVRVIGRGVAYGPGASSGTYPNSIARKVKFYLMQESAAAS